MRANVENFTPMHAGHHWDQGNVTETSAGSSTWWEQRTQADRNEIEYGTTQAGKNGGQYREEKFVPFNKIDLSKIHHL